MDNYSSLEHLEESAETPEIDPEIIAVITASTYSLLGTTQVVIRINRAKDSAWGHLGRQKLMDSRL